MDNAQFSEAISQLESLKVKFSEDKKTIISNPAITKMENHPFPYDTEINEFNKSGKPAPFHIQIPYGVTTIGEKAFREWSKLTSIEIPDSVTEIANGAFCGCTHLDNIRIPASVTTIGEDAFEGCCSLTSIEIPSSVTTIGNGAFGFCYKLSNVKLSSGLTTISDYAFFKCRSLSGMDIPDSVTTIGTSAFGWCDLMTSIKLPSGLTEISKTMLHNCRSLTEIIIPDCVSKIGESAFENCSKLEKVTISKNILKIYGSAFYNCKKLREVVLRSKMTDVEGAFNAKVKITFADTDSDKNELTPIEKLLLAPLPPLPPVETREEVVDFDADCRRAEQWITDNVDDADKKQKHIDSLEKIRKKSGTDAEKSELLRKKFAKAFVEKWHAALKKAKAQGIVFSEDNKTLLQCPETIRTVEIPSCVTTIGPEAFCAAQNYLLKVEIPDSVTTICDKAFCECEHCHIVLPESVTTIGKEAFKFCGYDSEINIPANVTSIGDGAFTGYRRLLLAEDNKRFALQDQGALIDLAAKKLLFVSHQWSGKYNIPRGITAIGASAFELNWKEGDKNSLEDLVIPEGVTSIGDNAFKYRRINKLVLPDSLCSIGAQAFQNCKGLTEVVIPDSVTTIGSGAFSGCEAGSVRLPSKLTKIEPNTFCDCKRLINLTLPDSVTELGNEAFSGCSALELKVSANVQSIGYGTFAATRNVVFTGCSKHI